jgi:hypothetical protein
VLPETAVSLPRTATATTTSFDPWDMPYFGAATYFSYQAALWHLGSPEIDAAVPAAPATPATASPLPSDPWDAPYFGGPAYFSYSPALPDRSVQPAPALLSTDTAASVPSNLQLELAPDVPAADNGAGEQTLVTNDPASPPRRGWWARLFSRS